MKTVPCSSPWLLDLCKQDPNKKKKIKIDVVEDDCTDEYDDGDLMRERERERDWWGRKGFEWMDGRKGLSGH